MLLLMAGVAASSAPLPGITGTVTLSPTCGGPDLEGRGCSQPLPHVVVRLLDATGATLAEARTDAQGHFDIPRPSVLGDLQLQVVTAGKLPRCPVVTVPAAGAAPLRIDCDSGRR